MTSTPTVAIGDEEKVMSTIERGHRYAARRLGAAVALGLAASLISNASYALGTPEQRAACTGDVIRLCVGSLGSDDGIIACMKRNVDKLSDRCKATLPNQGG
jgi:hypothetical protein